MLANELWPTGDLFFLTHSYYEKLSINAISPFPLKKNKSYDFINGQDIFVVIYVFASRVFRRSRTQFLCPLSSKLSTLCAALGTVASDRAVTSMPKLAINRSVLCWGAFMFPCTLFSDLMRRCIGNKHTGSDAAGEQGNSERWRGREDQDGAASSLSEPFCHCTPSGQPTQSPEI